MNRHSRVPVVMLILLVAAGLLEPRTLAQSRTPIDHYLSPAYPFELVSAKKTDRIAWLAFERGMRNVYTAAAPAFTPVRLTRNLEDDGIDLTNLSISDDGSTVVFVRGHAPNRAGWVANPVSDPEGAERTLWAARTAGGPAWKLAVLRQARGVPSSSRDEGGAPVLSPDGRAVLYLRDQRG